MNAMVNRFCLFLSVFKWFLVESIDRINVSRLKRWCTVNYMCRVLALSYLSTSSYGKCWSTVVLPRVYLFAKIKDVNLPLTNNKHNLLLWDEICKILFILAVDRATHFNAVISCFQSFMHKTMQNFCTEILVTVTNHSSWKFLLDKKILHRWYACKDACRSPFPICQFN